MEVDLEDLTWYLDHALDSMVEILRLLGDELANDKPALPGANSPFQLVSHCLGVLEFWGGERIAGRDVHRDRPAEFRASGRVDELVERVREQRTRFLLDLELLDSLAAPRAEAEAESKDNTLPFGRSQAGVVLHVFEELYQHLGHLEITRDLLVSVAGQAT
jgi:Protein of unknown function (DUF664)